MRENKMTSEQQQNYQEKIMKRCDFELKLIINHLSLID